MIIPVDSNDVGKSTKPASDPKPNCLVVQAANVVLDNTLIGSNNWTRDALKRYVSQLEDFPLFGTENDGFVIGNSRLAPLPMRSEAFRHYLTSLCELEQSQMPLSSNNVQLKKSPPGGTNRGTPLEEEPDFKSTESAATDVWTVTLSPLWIDFTGPNTTRYPRPMPFITDVPITVWLVPNIYPSTSGSESAEAAMVTVLLKLEGALKLLMERDQYLFLYQVMMDLGRLMQVLVDDAKTFTNTITTNSAEEDKSMANLSFCVCCLGPSIDLSLLLPSSVNVEVDAGASDRAMSRSSSDVSSSGKRLIILGLCFWIYVGILRVALIHGLQGIEARSSSTSTFDLMTRHA